MRTQAEHTYIARNAFGQMKLNRGTAVGKTIITRRRDARQNNNGLSGQFVVVLIKVH
jgi:hypothetical protein